MLLPCTCFSKDFMLAGSLTIGGLKQNSNQNRFRL